MTGHQTRIARFGTLPAQREAQLADRLAHAIRAYAAALADRVGVTP
jgi:hypothetical protein